MKKTVLVLITTLFMFLNSVAQVNLNNGLVAYYPFNGNANDESGNGNNGIITGANYTSDRNNKLSSAISVSRNTFNSGSGYVTTNANVGNIGTNDFTFSVWFNTKDLSNSQYLMGKRQNGLFGNQVDMAFHNNKIHLEISESSTNHIDIHGNTFVSTNSWHHAIFMKKSNIAYIYLDGVLDVSSVVGTINVSNSFPFTIGIVNDNSNNPFGFFNGKLDDIRIYNRTINEAEIQALYTEGQTVNLQNGLVAYYPFNGNANDESGNNLNGLFIGSGSFVIDRNEVTGAAYNFTASNSYFYTNDNILLRPQYVSISIWVKSSDFTNSILLQKVSLTGQNEQYSISVDANSKPSFAVKSGGACINGDAWREAKSTGTLLKNSWNHLVGTYDGNIVKFYVNKVLVAQYAHTGVIDNCPGSILKSGFYRTDIPHQYLGNIDDIRIYNRAINETEIQALYTEGQVVNLTNGLVAYYPFNGNANDESGRNLPSTTTGIDFGNSRFNDLSAAAVFNNQNDKVRSSIPATTNRNNWSISVWVKPATLTGSQVVFMNGYNKNCIQNGTPCDANGYGISINNGNIILQKLNITIIPSSYTITDANTWTHIFVSWDSQNNVSIVINGVRTDYFVDNILPQTPTEFIIGRWQYPAPGNTLESYGGEIDDLRIYDRALNNAEIQALYTEGQTVNLQNGLVAYYPFNGNANDESGNGNNGTVTGAILTIDRYNNNNRSYGFSGQNDNQIDIGHQINLGKNSYSISAWFKTSKGETGSNGGQRIISMGATDSNKGFVLGINYGLSGSISFASGSTSLPDQSKTVFIRTQSTTFNDNNWHYALAIVDKEQNRLKIYVDGILQPIQKVTPAIYGGVIVGNEVDISSLNLDASTSDPLGIGKLLTNPNENFEGDIDDIRIYNRVLNSAEINTLYTNNCASVSPPTVTLSNNRLSTTSFSDAAYQWYLNDFPISGTNNSTLANELTTGIYKVKASFANGCLATSKPVHVGTVSSPVTTVTVYEIKYVSDVENPNPKVGISIYPNPTNGIFYIDAQNIDLGYVEIQNIIGGNSIKAISTKEIDMKGFPNGIYILKLFDLHNKIVKVSKIFKTD